MFVRLQGGYGCGRVGRGWRQRGVLALLLYAKAIREERWLRGWYPAYRDYDRRVKRFVPWVWQPKQDLAGPSQTPASERARCRAWCFRE